MVYIDISTYKVNSNSVDTSTLSGSVTYKPFKDDEVVTVVFNNYVLSGKSSLYVDVAKEVCNVLTKSRTLVNVHNGERVKLSKLRSVIAIVKLRSFISVPFYVLLMKSLKLSKSYGEQY